MIDQLVVVHIRVINNGSDFTIRIRAAHCYRLMQISPPVDEISVDVELLKAGQLLYNAA